MVKQKVGKTSKNIMKMIVVVVKSALKPLKNNREGAYFLKSCISLQPAIFVKNYILSLTFLK